MAFRSPLRPLLVRALVLGAAAAGLVRAGMAVPGPLKRVVEGFGASTVEARRRTYGDAYTGAVDVLRAGIPPGGGYLAMASCEPGCEYWLRYDLSPRRMRLLDRLRTRDPGILLDAAAAEPGARLLLVESPDGPPRTTTLGALWGEAPPLPEDLRDEGLVVAVDTPVDGASSSDPLLVEGWCQEPGERPCAAVSLWLDGLPATVASFERYPRPDVARVLPEMGSCERAGYRARLYKPRPGAETSRLYAVFVTADGRWRKVGPVEVRWR